MADFDMSLIGDKAFELRLNSLGKQARKIVIQATRASAKRVRAVITSRTPVDTGKLKSAMAKAPIRVLRGLGIVGVGVGMPFREDLDIDADAKGYYPAAVEYGANGVAPNPFIRMTVDSVTAQEHEAIGRAIGTAVVRASRR